MMESVITQIVCLLDSYRKLLDSFVINFFVDDHWNALPQAWRAAFEEATFEETCELLLPLSQDEGMKHGRACVYNRVWPMSLLAFLKATRTLTLDRRQRILKGKFRMESEVEDPKTKLLEESKLVSEHLLLRHVKPKKQHELMHLSEVVSDVAQQTSCSTIVDVGSGQGHLSRYLSYVHSLDVISIEAIGCHLQNAAKFDLEVEVSLDKKRRKMIGEEAELYRNMHGKCCHVTTMLKPQVTAEEFSELMAPHLAQLRADQIKDRVKMVDSLSSKSVEPHPHIDTLELQPVDEVTSDDKFILVGLHTCGDLGPSILRMFTENPNACGLVSVGCCYMKTTTREDHPPEPVPLGYPMSQFVSSVPGHSLSYQAREVACHAIENYAIRTRDNPEHLKVHCFRATMETVLRQHGLKQAHVKLSKKQSKLPFEGYAIAVMKSVGLDAALDIKELEPKIHQWQHVAIFFIIRVLLAPCVESLVLLDRVMYLKEKGCAAHLVPLFDPKQSPRNTVIVTHKDSWTSRKIS